MAGLFLDRPPKHTHTHTHTHTLVGREHFLFPSCELTSNYHLVPGSSKSLLLNIYHPQNTSQIQFLVYNKSQQSQDTNVPSPKKTSSRKAQPFPSCAFTTPCARLPHGPHTQHMVKSRAQRKGPEVKIPKCKQRWTRVTASG